MRSSSVARRSSSYFSSKARRIIIPPTMPIRSTPVPDPAIPIACTRAGASTRSGVSGVRHGPPVVCDLVIWTGADPTTCIPLNGV